MEAMSAFWDSTEFVNNGTELRRCLDEDSYIFIRGLLPENTILNIAVKIPGTWVTGAFKAGDVLIFSNTMVHKALPNKSNEIRQSLDARNQPASAPIAKTKFKTLFGHRKLPRSVFWMGLWNRPVLLGTTKLRSETIWHKLLRGKRTNGFWNRWKRRPISPG